MRYNPGTRRLVRHILASVGALATLIGAALLVATTIAVANSKTTVGIVVAFKGTTPPHTSKGPPPQPSVAPVVAFTGPDGKEQRFTAQWYATEPSHALGDRVPVRYRSDNPQSAWIDSFAETWLLPAVLTVLGGVLALIGLLLPAGRPS